MSESKSSFHVEHKYKQEDVPRGTKLRTLQKCPLCLSNQLSQFLTCKDYTATHESFKLDLCKDCGFLFTNPQPTPDILYKYYLSPDYISHSETKTGLINRLYHLVQSLNLRYKFNVCSLFAPPGQWIDYGSGAGAFLKYASFQNQIISGYEPDPKARLACIEKKQNVHPIEEYNVLDSQVACISMWHVLEHISNFQQVLQIHTQNLKPNGVLIIAVPNHRSYDASYYKNEWAAYDVPRHLWHFSEKDMRRLGENLGITLEHIRPLIFDSFYVSMLSEKNQNGYTLRGIFIGLLSNIKASVNHYPYSSQIYVFRKKPL